MLKAAKTVAAKRAANPASSDPSRLGFTVEDYRNVLQEAMDYIRFINGDDYSVVVGHIEQILSAPPIFLPSDPSPSQHVTGWQTMETAPHEGSIIVWWPIVKLDDDGDSTDEIVDGQAVLSEWNGGYWLEPEVLNAIGDHMGDDFTYADNPSHWMPPPAAPVTTEGQP